MVNQNVRSAIVLILLCGTFALAVPYVSNFVDGWLFSAGEEKVTPKWKSQRPTTTPGPVAPAAGPAQLTSFEQPEDRPGSPGRYPLDQESAIGNDRLAFDYREEHTPAREVPAVAGTGWNEQVSASNAPLHEPAEIERLQHELQDLGATYFVVEQSTDDEHFECRCLLPLAPQSNYQKAFSGVGSSPTAALEQAIAEVRAWRARR